MSWKLQTLTLGLVGSVVFFTVMKHMRQTNVRKGLSSSQFGGWKSIIRWTSSPDEGLMGRWDQAGVNVRERQHH